MENPILQMLNSGSRNAGANNIMMQAIGAMMRGESPQAFLKNLANTNPQLKNLDLDNLDMTARQLYSDKGQDINAAKSSIMAKIGNFINHK